MNLRSSHREMSQLRLKHVNKSLHDLVNQFMEERFEDHCIRQRLQPDKEAIVKRGQFYALLNESRAEPGFLIFLPSQPAVWTTMRGPKPVAFSLRMRTDVTLGDGGGTVLIASLDKIGHILRLEDVYMWKGDKLFARQGFLERRKTLQQFVERHWTPDARLMGGITTTIAQPQPLRILSTLEDLPHSIDLIPELPNKRRFYFFASDAPAPALAPAPAPAAPATQAPTVSIQQTTATIRAFAVALESLPDVYDLFMENNTPLCRAAVQQLALSQKLRGYKSQKIPVIASWNKEFGRYEITDCIA